MIDRDHHTYLCLIGDRRLVGELHLGRLQYRVLLQNGGLRLIVAERLLAVQALVEYHADAPHVHFGRDLGRILAHHKAFGRQVPARIQTPIIRLSAKLARTFLLHSSASIRPAPHRQTHTKTHGPAIRLTSTCPLPATSSPCHGRDCSSPRPSPSTDQSR